jgi:regulator of extracellular matrix RemA (YlzA/DUF370 family)
MSRPILVDVGYGSTVSISRIIAVVAPDSMPTKKLINEAKEKGLLVDATYGRKTRSAVITDSGHLVLSQLQPETIAKRINGKEIDDE